MLARRSGPLLLTAFLAVAGCKDVSQRSITPTIVIATFSSPNIPTPNDLALQATPTLTAPALAAQKDLLQSFVDGGGFPADQAPTLSVPIRAYDWDAATNTYVARCQTTPCAASTLPTVDPTTVTVDTAALFRVDVDPPVRIAVEAVSPQVPGSVNLVPVKDATGSRRLPAGRYVFAIRGGDGGVKTADGLPIGADVPIALTIPNKDLTNKENQPPGGLSPAQLAQLEPVQAVLWNPVGWLTADLGDGNVWIPCLPSALDGAPDPLVAACTAANAKVKVPAYSAIDPAFPHAEVASIAAFQIAASTAAVPLVDAASGQAPLPIDLLRTGPGGTIAPNPAFGAAGAGLVTLDGFSTTAMVLAPTSLPVADSTVPGNVFLYKLSKASPPVPTLVPELKANGPATARYVVQPTPLIIPETKNITAGLACPTGTGGCSPAIGLQPAVPVPTSPTTVLPLPPLDEDTTYAVVITNGVKDILGRRLGRPTIMTLLTETHPVAAGGISLVGGIDNSTATAIETMRGQLAPVLSVVPGGAANVALAYTFKTQTFKETSLALAAAPYSIEHGAGGAIFTPTAATAVTAPAGVPTTGVAAFYDVTFKSIDAIDKTTGALRPTLEANLADPVTVASLLTDLHALVAVPTAAPACPSPPFPAGTHCAPLVVFGHGLNGSKETMFAVASSLAQAGFVAAAIDFPLHGGRNWCSQNSDCVVPVGGAVGTCTPFTGGAGQGDQVPPGVCSGGSVPVTAGSRYFIGANFFRTRDAFRQNLLDVGALVLALDRPPTLPAPAANPFTALLPTGLLVDARFVYYEGLSLGSISGTSVLAVNSRMSRGSLSVGGGTVVDVFTNSPAFQGDVQALFTGLLSGVLGGQTFSFTMIDPTNAAFSLPVATAYLQTLNVAKWILDPGDPVNYALNLIGEPLPNLLANPDGSVPQAAKLVYGQLAQNDPVVPNPFNLELYGLIGADQTFYTGAGATHGMLATQPLVQEDAAGFLATTPPTIPPTTRNLP